MSGERGLRLTALSVRSFIAVENVDSYCVLISSKAVYFLRSGDYVDREAVFLEVKYDDLYHCLVSKDHGKVYVQVTKKAVNSSSGVAIPGPSHQKPMVSVPWPEFPAPSARLTVGKPSQHFRPRPGAPEAPGPAKSRVCAEGAPCVLLERCQPPSPTTKGPGRAGGATPGPQLPVQVAWAGIPAVSSYQDQVMGCMQVLFLKWDSGAHWV